jgi:ribonuclease-3
MMRPEARARFEERLGWTFRDEVGLAQALAHRSWCAENPDEPSNERLEFLGDAVLGIVVTDYVFRTYPLLQEGQLAKVRASVVNAEVLAEVAADVELGPWGGRGAGGGAAGGRAKN